jgi:hypothetical protein
MDGRPKKGGTEKSGQSIDLAVSARDLPATVSWRYLRSMALHPLFLIMEGMCPHLKKPTDRHAVVGIASPAECSDRSGRSNRKAVVTSETMSGIFTQDRQAFHHSLKPDYRVPQNPGLSA